MTLRNRSRKLADQVTKNNAVLNRLNEKGKIKTFSGGRTIVQELEYSENATYTRYAGFSLVPLAA
jgi:predicted transcriptional regulator of viral defense system